MNVLGGGGGVWLGKPRVQVTGSERNRGEFNENEDNLSQPKFEK
jgi:hypothetical protein